jgi:hypothetical protein
LNPILNNSITYITNIYYIFTEALGEKNLYDDQVQKDVDRSFIGFDAAKALTKRERQLKKIQLKLIILAILNRNQFHYYQVDIIIYACSFYILLKGFNDFCSIFLMVLGENLGFHVAEIASRFLLKYYFVLFGIY